jgi:hypothetical protein
MLLVFDISVRVGPRQKNSSFLSFSPIYTYHLYSELAAAMPTQGGLVYFQTLDRLAISLTSVY